MEDYKQHEKFMRMAIRLAEENVDKISGGPFGAVIVKDGKVIAKSANKVTVLNDPTAHAEVSAIRKAAKRLNTYDLSGCIVYTSCEPCPMCLGAIYWSQISRIYYANTKLDAAAIGFNDKFIYDELSLPMTERKLPAEQLLHEEAIITFQKWAECAGKLEY